MSVAPVAGAAVDGAAVPGAVAVAGAGAGVGFVGVPLMALTMSPVQAAAILLPILCLMDIVSVWTWWGVYDRRTLRDTLHGAVLSDGIARPTPNAMIIRHTATYQ